MTPPDTDQPALDYASPVTGGERMPRGGWWRPFLYTVVGTAIVTAVIAVGLLVLFSTIIDGRD